MTVLVTGADGFVGAHLVAELLAAGRETVAVHRGSPVGLRAAGLLDGAGLAPVLARADVTDPVQVDEVLDRYRPTLVVHAAAATPDRRIEREQAARVLCTNELGTLHVLLAAARCGVRRVVYVSSTAVYAGGDPAALLDEDAELSDPGGLYAVSKLGSERLCRWATQQFGLDTRSVRVGPVYGPFERPTASRPAMSIVLEAIRLALAGEPLRCAAPSFARDFIHGHDTARAILGLLDARALSHSVYNLAGERVTMERLLPAVVAAVPGTEVAWVDSPEEANIPGVVAGAPSRIVDTGRLRAAVGFTETFAIEDGVRDVVSWLRRPSGT